jgi:hypothetical protein
MIVKEDPIEKDPYCFEEFFYRDLESWFSSDIACCDECYDDFLENWPHAYSADKEAFQRSSIDVDSFYSGSRLQEYYTQEQFDKLLCLIHCPRCGAEISGNIWPYTLPFDVVDDFEYIINEIADISNKTPFLLLNNQFARVVYETIIELAKESTSKKHEKPLYRARTKHSLASKEIIEFDFPPKNYVKEGRYNHAGIPALYLGSDPATCFFELRETSCVIAEIEIYSEIKILDLTDTYKNHPKHSDLLNTLVYSALMSARQDDSGWYKPKYIFTRFISDCAKYAGFDAIKYPSTRKNGENYNIVIINEDLSLNKKSNLLRLLECENGKVEEI